MYNNSNRYKISMLTFYQFALWVDSSLRPKSNGRGNRICYKLSFLLVNNQKDHLSGYTSRNLLFNFRLVLGDPEMAWLMRSLSVATKTGWSAGLSGFILPFPVSLLTTLAGGRFLIVLGCWMKMKIRNFELWQILQKLITLFKIKKFWPIF